MEAWFLKYHMENGLFTLYAADKVSTFNLFIVFSQSVDFDVNGIFQDAFAVDHREAGIHHESSQGAQSHKISKWSLSRSKII